MKKKKKKHEVNFCQMLGSGVQGREFWIDMPERTWRFQASDDKDAKAWHDLMKVTQVNFYHCFFLFWSYNVH